MSQLPQRVHAVVDAGVHGLSMGWHLALERAGRRPGSGRDVVVLDQTACGRVRHACGGLRNLGMTEPLHASLRHRVDVRTCDPVAFGVQQVGGDRAVSPGRALESAVALRAAAPGRRR
jgi:hypothetical protein